MTHSISIEHNSGGVDLSQVVLWGDVAAVVAGRVQAGVAKVKAGELAGGRGVKLGEMDQGAT